MTHVTMSARPPGGEPKRSSGIELFRVRQIPDSVESRPVSSVAAEPASINPPASKHYYFWLMSPAILVLAFISIYPFFWMIYMSLHDVDIGRVEWNNFENFTRLAGDTRFVSGWLLLIQYSLLCLALQCQSALKRDPVSASKRDPLCLCDGRARRRCAEPLA